MGPGNSKPLIIALSLLLSALGGYGLYQWRTSRPDQEPKYRTTISALESGVLKFNKQIVLAKNHVTVDDQEPERVNCVEFVGHEPVIRPEQLKATVLLDRKTQASLKCDQDEKNYGISLVLSSQKNLRLIAAIYQATGTQSEVRSYLSRNSRGSLVIEKVKITSYEDVSVSPNTLIGCDALSQTLEWNPETQNFQQIAESKTFDEGRFDPPRDISENCFDQNGRWKGTFTLGK